jgi:hypothetical protein
MIIVDVRPLSLEAIMIIMDFRPLSLEAIMIIMDFRPLSLEAKRVFLAWDERLRDSRGDGGAPRLLEELEEGGGERARGRRLETRGARNGVLCVPERLERHAGGLERDERAGAWCGGEAEAEACRDSGQLRDGREDGELLHALRVGGCGWQLRRGAGLKALTRWNRAKLSRLSCSD